MSGTWRRLCLVALLVLAVALGVTRPVDASPFGAGTFGNCQFGSCSISLSTQANMELNVIPAGSGACSVRSNVVSVSTDNSNGYTLLLTSTSANTDLTRNTRAVHATSATYMAPTALPVNTWGYRVDNVGNFGGGPTASASNVPSLSTTFAGVPALESPGAVLASTSVPASPSDQTTVWYGICANTTLPSGIYSGEILYTALTN